MKYKRSLSINKISLIKAADENYRKQKYQLNDVLYLWSTMTHDQCSYPFSPIYLCGGNENLFCLMIYRGHLVGLFYVNNDYSYI